jgi:hypothetical protein
VLVPRMVSFFFFWKTERPGGGGGEGGQLPERKMRRRGQPRACRRRSVVDLELDASGTASRRASQSYPSPKSKSDRTVDALAENL